LDESRVDTVDGQNPEKKHLLDDPILPIIYRVKKPSQVVGNGILSINNHPPKDMMDFSALVRQSSFFLRKYAFKQYIYKCGVCIHNTFYVYTKVCVYLKTHTYHISTVYVKIRYTILLEYPSSFSPRDPWHPAPL